MAVTLLPVGRAGVPIGGFVGHGRRPDDEQRIRIPDGVRPAHVAEVEHTLERDPKLGGHPLAEVLVGDSGRSLRLQISEIATGPREQWPGVVDDGRGLARERAGVLDDVHSVREGYPWTVLRKHATTGSLQPCAQ